MPCNLVIRDVLISQSQHVHITCVLLKQHVQLLPASTSTNQLPIVLRFRFRKCCKVLIGLLLDLLLSLHQIFSQLPCRGCDCFWHCPNCRVVSAVSLDILISSWSLFPVGLLRCLWCKLYRSITFPSALLTSFIVISLTKLAGTDLLCLIGDLVRVEVRDLVATNWGIEAEVLGSLMMLLLWVLVSVGASPVLV